MTDKDLLALAAKAHGDLTYIPDCDGWIHELPDGTRGAWWQPLRDDGDALRLAVKLGITVTPYPIYDYQKHSMLARQARRGDQMRETNPTEACETCSTDLLAATRRVIVRSAAAIGKGMP